MTAPTHPEPRPDDEGREIIRTDLHCDRCGAKGQPVKGSAQGGSWWWECVGPCLLTPTDGRDALTEAGMIAEEQGGAIARVAKLRHRVGAGGSCRCEDCRAIKQVVALAREALAMKKSRRALTPHPAPLGATDEPSLASQYAKVCAEHEEATRAMSSRIVYVGATDEGLLTAIREHCRVVYYPPNAEYPIEHAPLAGKDSWDELRAALQAGPR